MGCPGIAKPQAAIRDLMSHSECVQAVMSFKLFIYYCAVCGAWAAFLGWAVAQFITPESATLRSSLRGLSLGLFVALALGMVDALWNISGHQYGKVMARSFLDAVAACVAVFLG